MAIIIAAYTGVQYKNFLDMVVICLYTNIFAIRVVKVLKKWSVFLKPIFFLPVQNARVRIPERKFQLLLLLGQLFRVEALLHPAAAAVRAAVFPEQANFDAGREPVF